MQTILAFAASAASTVSAAFGFTAPTSAGAAAAATTTSVAAAGAASGLSALQIAGLGLSAVSALSLYGQGQLEAQAQKSEAVDAELQARQEWTQGQEQANAIDLEYNRVVQQQLEVASASGIDVSSGSVIQARADSRAEADRQLTITRNGVDVNAALRRGRAQYLRGAAKLTAEAGGISAIGRAGDAIAKYTRIG